MTVHYSQDSLCDHIASGRSLVSWCKENEIGYSTIMAHLAADKAFQDKYAMAKEHQADYLAEEILEICDESEIRLQDGQAIGLDATAVARNRLRVDTRKWVAAKMRPKKYGDKTTTELTGANGGPIVTHPQGEDILKRWVLANPDKIKEYQDDPYREESR